MHQNNKHINQNTEMKQDEYSAARPTLKRWSKINPTAGSRWARPKTGHQAQTNFVVSFWVRAIIKSEVQPADMQFKRAAKLLTVTGLTHDF